MVSDEGKENAYRDLVAVIENIGDLLKISGENPLDYRGLEKVKKIAQNRDPEGMKRVARILDGEFRVLYDNRVSAEKLEKQMERAYSIADQFLSMHVQR